MQDFNPYEKSYRLTDILKGLEFYYKLLDRIEPEIFTDEKFPIKRGELISTIKYLNDIPSNHFVNQLVQSHPFLTKAFDNIESFRNIDNDTEKYNLIRFLIYTWVENLLHSGCFILFHKYQFDYKDICKNKKSSEILSFLIEEKAKYKLNSESYSRIFLKFLFDFIDIEIDKNNSLKELDSSQIISKEASELIKNYLEQIQERVEKNDLSSSLLKKEYEKFIYKLKSFLYIPSYYDITIADRERAFHIFILGILKGRIEFYNLKSNKESGLGRYDICLHPIDKRNAGVIIEIKKVDENTNEKGIESELDSALNQINEKKYYFELREDGIKEILAISIVFNGLEPNIKWNIMTNNNEC